MFLGFRVWRFELGCEGLGFWGFMGRTGTPNIGLSGVNTGLRRTRCFTDPGVSCRSNIEIGGFGLSESGQPRMMGTGNLSCAYFGCS